MTSCMQRICAAPAGCRLLSCSATGVVKAGVFCKVCGLTWQGLFLKSVQTPERRLRTQRLHCQENTLHPCNPKNIQKQTCCYSFLRIASIVVRRRWSGRPPR